MSVRRLLKTQVALKTRRSLTNIYVGFSRFGGQLPSQLGQLTQITDMHIDEVLSKDVWFDAVIDVWHA